MANVPKTSRCLNCDSPIASGRLKRFPNAVLCSSLDCYVEQQNAVAITRKRSGG